MGFTDGYRYWSILQVVAIVLCYRGSTSHSTTDTIHLTDEQSTDDESLSTELETTTYEKQTTIQGEEIYSTEDKHSKGVDIIPVADPEANTGDAIYSTIEEQSTTVGDINHGLDLESTTETSIAGIVICCLIILLVITILVYALYQWRKNAQAKPIHPVEMVVVYNRQDEGNTHATQGTSQQYNDDPLSLYTVIEETPAAIYSEEQQTEAICKDDQRERVATDKDKAVTETQPTVLNVYTTVDTPSTTTSTYSTLEADQVGVKGVADEGDSSPDQVYSLATNAMENIYAKEAAVDSPAQLEAGTVSKTPMPQDDGCQTVIENDLYGTTDNSAKETLVDSPTHVLGGIVSKVHATQDDGGQTVIENDLYGTSDNGAKEKTVSPPTLLLTKL